MAEVYAARVRGEAGFQKLVAVKRMLPQLADDEEFTTMFLDEARLAANISSPHCVSTLDLGRAEDRSLYIVMELVVGVTLAKILKWSVKNRHPIPVPVAVELICQAAHGLHDAHEAKTPLGQPLEIVHRDVSPQNVLVGVDGRVRLTDFGVARAVQRMTETIAGRVKGKFAYMAPEQLTAQPIDRRADVFSLGVVAWEFFTGTRLFLGEHPAETMDRVRNMPILAVNEVRSDIPPLIAEVIAWALERDPNERCPSAREFELNLRQAAQKSGIESDRDGVVRFVQGAGGKSLDKMRNNIKVALTDRPGDALEGGLEQPLEHGLTPSGIQPSSSGAADTHDTAPTTGGGQFGVRLDMDASAPSAAAHPGEVITQLRLDADDAAGHHVAGAKSRGPLLIGLMGAAVIALGGVIGIVIALSGDTAVEPVVTDLANPSVATPPAVPDPIVTETVTEAEADGQALDPEAAPEEDSAPVADEPAATPRTATRRRNDRRRRNMRQVAAAPVEPTVTETPPAMATAMTTTTTASPPTMTMTARPRMDRGLVGLDAFDQGLNMR